MIRIERMTAGALRRGGIDEVRMSLLLRDALNGSDLARRALERACGAELELVTPRNAERCPLRCARLTGEWRDAVLSCRVDLRPGTWWDFDTLHGEMPDTLKVAIPGRRLHEVMDHPDADGEAIAHEPRERGGLLSVAATHLEPQATTGAQRLAHRRHRMALLLDEAKMDEPVDARFRPMMDMMAIGTVIVAIFLLHLPQDGWDRTFVTALACLSAVYAISNTVNMRRTRPLSMLQAMLPEPRHQELLENLKTMRKRA